MVKIGKLFCYITDKQKSNLASNYRFHTFMISFNIFPYLCRMLFLG
jgi:hypothetical protein